MGVISFEEEGSRGSKKKTFWGNNLVLWGLYMPWEIEGIAYGWREGGLERVSINWILCKGINSVRLYLVPWIAMF